MPLSVLIVEDQPLTALSLVDLVERGGHEVTAVAATAREALRAARERRPDLALVDVELEGSADGVEAAWRMRDELDVRSLFLTGHTGPDVRDRAQAAWPLGFIAKPFSPASVERELRSVAALLDARRRASSPVA